MSEQLAIIGAALITSAVVGGGLYFFGKGEARDWAIPGAVAILVGGVGYAFYWPPVITLGVFLAALFLLHRSAKKNLGAAAKRATVIDVPDVGLTLRLERSPQGGAVAQWKAAPKLQPGAAPGTAPAGISLVWNLDFHGITRDEYAVILRTELPKCRPGMIVCHHFQARGDARGLVPDVEPITGIPGLTPDIVARSSPNDYGFDMLDIRTLSILSELFKLRTATRDVYMHVSGAVLRIVSNENFETPEIRQLLKTATLLALRARFLGEQLEA